MQLNLSADEVLATTRSVRKRLDFERPVEREVLMECLDLALQAPSGSNRQAWRWLFVTDDATKLALRDIYRENFEWYVAQAGPTYADDDPRLAGTAAMRASSAYLAEHLHRVPVLLIPCLAGRPSDGTGGSTAAFWGSILPAAWSFMLALRERAMGSAWTTMHLIRGGEQRAAELLGIPFDRYSQAGLFPIAYTVGTDFKPASRLPAEQVAHWDEFPAT